MSYSIEKSRNANLENTAIPNLFITDFLPDVPDGDFVKVFIYAYMCCKEDIALTHPELADRLGLDTGKVISAWKYFADRRIVKLTPLANGDNSHFDVEFVDVKGLLYGGGAGAGGYGAGGDEAGAESRNSTLNDEELAALFGKISAICGNASLDGGDAQRIISWIDEGGATPEIIEYAWQFCLDERGEKGIGYVEKIVKDWAGRGLKTIPEARDHIEKTDARSAVHKQLMEALGMRYSVITSAEIKKFNMWIDDYGYTPARLLELADKTAGVGNKFKYLGGIIRKEREAEGKAPEPAPGAKQPRGMKDRNEYYRKKRQKNEDEAAARLDEIYAKLPEIRQIDDEISLMNIELVKTLTSGKKDKKSAVERLDTDIKAEHERRGDLLEKAGFPKDYTDIHVGCPRCQDSGVLENGASCDCYKLG